jgi:hypothetical protein
MEEGRRKMEETAKTELFSATDKTDPASLLSAAQAPTDGR